MAKNRNDQPSRRIYTIYPSAINTRKIKRATESYKLFAGKSRLTPEEKNMLAYFCSSFEFKSPNIDKELAK